MIDEMRSKQVSYYTKDFFLCLQVETSSFLLLRVHRLGLQIGPHIAPSPCTFDLRWLWPANNRSPTCRIPIFAIWSIFGFWTSLTFDPLTVGRTKRSPWTRLHVCPYPTGWFCYFAIWNSSIFWLPLTFDPIQNNNSNAQI